VRAVVSVRQGCSVKGAVVVSTVEVVNGGCCSGGRVVVGGVAVDFPTPKQPVY
jgi:hypothetical protein